MHILIKNKSLIFNNYKVKCALGKRGIGVKKKEGDQITPRGSYKIRGILYRRDKIKNLKTKLIKKVINKKMGWCDDPKSKKYNQLIKLPSKFNFEKLYRNDDIYDIVFILNFNTSPVKKNKGSAIFVHIAKKNYLPTRGCIAIKKNDIKKLAREINRKTLVKIL
tara:strand:+ start:177 stop:668 length:492 start_codon:yes stop_codon:yes gene_type:complete